MKFPRQTFNTLLCILATLFTGGCDSDPLGMSRRAITNDYVLEYFDENQKFYLIRKGDPNANGPLEGHITAIGTRSTIIIAHRIPSYQADHEGWFIINTATHHIKGPLSQREAMSDPQAAGIVIKTAKEFFATGGAD